MVLAGRALVVEAVLVEEARLAGVVGELEEVAETRRRDGKHGGPVVAHAVGRLARQRQRPFNARRVLVREVAAHRSEVAGLAEEANVEPVTGQRLHEWRTRPVSYGGESQSGPIP